MSRDAITKLEQERQKKQIEQTLEEASWDIPKLLKINARLVKEKHEQAEQITALQKAFARICGGQRERMSAQAKECDYLEGVVKEQDKEIAMLKAKYICPLCGVQAVKGHTEETQAEQITDQAEEIKLLKGGAE